MNMKIHLYFQGAFDLTLGKAIASLYARHGAKLSWVVAVEKPEHFLPHTANDAVRK